MAPAPSSPAETQAGDGAATDAALRRRLSRVDAWVFDLDKTLYPADSDLWERIDQRMTVFIADRLSLDGLSARALQKHYYYKHGTTLRGLMNENGIDPHVFLDFVHDVDRACLARDEALAKAIDALPGRKFIFTNGSARHAADTIEQLGLSGLFDGVFDIVAGDLTPKPHRAPYEKFLARFDVDPRRAAMFEDIAVNLAAPREMGMATILVGEAEAPDWVDATTRDLARFLDALRARRDGT